MRLHLMMDGAGDHIARGQILPIGRILGHERPAVGRQQHAALAAHRLADQEAFGAGRGQRRRVKLDVLGVDDARTRRDWPAPAHRRASRAGWSCCGRCGPARRSPARSRRPGGGGWCARLGRTGTRRGMRSGDRRPADPRVVRKGDQIHHGHVGRDRDVRAAAQHGDRPGHDGLTRAIPHVEDAPRESAAS